MGCSPMQRFIPFSTSPMKTSQTHPATNAVFWGAVQYPKSSPHDVGPRGLSTWMQTTTSPAPKTEPHQEHNSERIGEISGSVSGCKAYLTLGVSTNKVNQRVRAHTHTPNARCFTHHSRLAKTGYRCKPCFCDSRRARFWPV